MIREGKSIQLAAARQRPLERLGEEAFDLAPCTAGRHRGDAPGAPRALERRIRERRRALRQRTLRAHVDANATTLDALPAAQRALFQDRESLLHLPFDELENTIEQRIEVWQATLADPDAGSADDPDASDRDASPPAASASDGDRVIDAELVSDAPTPVVDDASPTRADVATDADEGPRAWRVTIDLSAPRAKADQLFARVRDRWKTDRAVTGVDLSAVD